MEEKGGASAEKLRLFVERIERLEEEKKGIADDIKDVKAEAKGQGFDVATINALIKLRKLKPEKRREQEALLDTYKAALGMLDGTPLGRWAVERLEGEHDDDQGGDDAAPPPTNSVPDTDVDGARELGTAAAKEGKPVTANPFPARDIRRAAWDEAWCSELGTDGMDIPDAWKPAPKKPQPPEGDA
ncbi:hypothetical protein HY78_18840 [Rhizorhabdus wittichii DC-6]|nr:hypothetical protein HY78_18840 [Rhizorhabdus wittichii DC-6]